MPRSRTGGSVTRICTGIAVLTLLALLLLMWLPFTLYSGFNLETGFIYNNETSSFWQGFRYPWDPMRPYSSFFYHLAYILSEAAHMRGSFVPYQLVHAALWLARGILTFLILRKFLPDHIPFCFLAGVIALVHASDTATQWVGQMDKLGFIFWILLAFYLLNLAIESSRQSLFVLLTLAACLCEYLSLWSYEAQLFLILVAPLTLLLFRRVYARRILAASMLWYLAPIQYLAATWVRYRSTGGGSYQESVIRKSWNAATGIGDWWFNIRSSLAFWNWTGSTPVVLPATRLMQFASAGVLIFVIGACALLVILGRRERPDILRAPAKPLWCALAAGYVVTALSFPVYLLLASPRALWRTQFLSGIGAAITIAAVVCLAVRYSPTRVIRAVAFVLCGAAVTAAGVHAAIVRGAFTRMNWERHRSAIAGILSVFPSVKPDTVFIYTGVSKPDDPFIHKMWFDMALRLAYPGTPVAGDYFYEDGSAAPGNCFRFDGGRCRCEGTGVASLVNDTSVRNLVVVEFQKQGPARIAPTPPVFLHLSPEAAAIYSPQAVLRDERASPIAVRRYGPIPLPRSDISHVH